MRTREQVVAEHQAAVLSAWSELAKASTKIARYGVVEPMALRYAAAEPRRLARGPARPVHRGVQSGTGTAAPPGRQPGQGDGVS